MTEKISQAKNGASPAANRHRNPTPKPARHTAHSSVGTTKSTASGRVSATQAASKPSRSGQARVSG
jgi:hypothetical protein